MEFRFVVFSRAVEKLPVQATLPNGDSVAAEVAGLVIELVPEDGGDTGQTLRFIPPDINATIAEYEPGTVVVATYQTEQA